MAQRSGQSYCGLRYVCAFAVIAYVDDDGDDDDDVHGDVSVVVVIVVDDGNDDNDDDADLHHGIDRT